MNTVTAIRIDYPKAPKGWKGMGFYFEKRELGAFEMPDESFMEDCIDAVRERFPRANQFNISDAKHPSGWASGSV